MLPAEIERRMKVSVIHHGLFFLSFPAALGVYLLTHYILNLFAPDTLFPVLFGLASLIFFLSVADCYAFSLYRKKSFPSHFPLYLLLDASVFILLGAGVLFPPVLLLVPLLWYLASRIPQPPSKVIQEIKKKPFDFLVKTFLLTFSCLAKPLPPFTLLSVISHPFTTSR